MTMRHPLIRLALFASVLLANVPWARADAVTKRQKLEDLFRLIQIDKTLQQVGAQQVKQVQTMLNKGFLGEKMTPEQKKDVDDLVVKLMGITQEAMSWPKVEPQFVDLYASTYTEEEVDGMIAFYKTPTGMSMIAKQPELLTKTQAVAQAQLALVQPKMIAAVKQFAEEMDAKYPTAAH